MPAPAAATSNRRLARLALDLTSGIRPSPVVHASQSESTELGASKLLNRGALSSRCPCLPTAAQLPGRSPKEKHAAAVFL